MCLNRTFHKYLEQDGIQLYRLVTQKCNIIVINVLLITDVGGNSGQCNWVLSNIVFYLDHNRDTTVHWETKITNNYAKTWHTPTTSIVTHIAINSRADIIRSDADSLLLSWKWCVTYTMVLYRFPMQTVLFDHLCQAIIKKLKPTRPY